MARSGEKLNERKYPSMPLAGFEPGVKLINIRQETYKRPLRDTTDHNHTLRGLLVRNTRLLHIYHD
jgi:hypothetical protein